MLHEFLKSYRSEIIARCRAKIASRPAPRPTSVELELGVPLFLDQLADTLRLGFKGEANPAIIASAGEHGRELLRRGFSIAQVVNDYGDICQTIGELSVELAAQITNGEFLALNSSLDAAIAAAVSEYGRMRAHEGAERLGVLAHELRNLLTVAILSFESLKTGEVDLNGSTAELLTRTLTALRSLVDREFAEVRLDRGVHNRETVVVREFIEDVEIGAAIEAKAKGLEFSVTSVDDDVTVYADRQILTSVVVNLLQNAFKFTRRQGHVSLRAHATSERVLIDVEDECGGLPPGTAEELFRPFEQRGNDVTGLGLGLTICERGARVNDGEVHVHNDPGAGCVFTLDLPRQPTLAV